MESSNVEANNKGEANKGAVNSSKYLAFNPNGIQSLNSAESHRRSTKKSQRSRKSGTIREEDSDEEVIRLETFQNPDMQNEQRHDNNNIMVNDTMNVQDVD